MKIRTGLIMLCMMCGCSDSDPTTRQSSDEMIERYEDPVDAAGAAADQVQQIRENQTGQ